MQTEHKHYFARIPIIALLILLGLAPWLAVLLFILRAIDKDAEKREQRAFDANRRYAADFRPEDTRPGADRQAGPGAPTTTAPATRPTTGPPPSSRKPKTAASASSAGAPYWAASCCSWGWSACRRASPP